MRPQLLLAAFSALFLGSCYSPGDGQAPPLESLYFPTGLVLDPTTTDAAGHRLLPAPAHLYIASSDFDLQYRSSALASYDLEALSKVIPKRCATAATCDAGQTCDTSSVGDHVASFFCVDANTLDPCPTVGARSLGDQLLYPGRCNSIDPKASGLIRDTVGIGAFATDIIVRSDAASSTERLFLPVRGDATLHWIDVKDGKFSCNQAQTSDGSCDDLHRAGDSTAENANQLRQPSEPFGVDATADGGYIAVTNQTTGSVSLFVNHWDATVGPTLESILGYLPLAPVAIAALPKSTSDATPGFLVAYRNAAQIDLLRVRSDLADTGMASASYTRYALTLAGTTPINANSLGFDSRGMVIDESQRLSDYASCCRALSGDAKTACISSPSAACQSAAHQPDVYVANRAPSSLLIGAMTADASYIAGSSELPSFSDSVALAAGPSRVVKGFVVVAGSDAADPDNNYADAVGDYHLELRLFVVCFDSRRIFVYDPKRRQIDSIINTGRGPFALAIDELRGLAYVAHFTDSYLGVISLDQRFPQTYATIIASVGTPSPPRTSK